MPHSHDPACDRRQNYRGPDLQLFFRDLRDPQNKKRRIIVKTWSTIQDVKNAIAKKTQISPQAQRLYYGPLVPLPNHRTLNDAGIYKDGEVLLLDIVQDQAATGADIRIASSMSELTPKPLRSVIQKCRRGLAKGYKPELVMDGSGGTYYLHNECKVKIAVFKPADEEPYAENNPRGYVGGGIMRDGIAPGQACLREVAAYLLDHGGFCSVPLTTLAEARHASFHVNGRLLNLAQGGASLGNHSLTPNKKAKLSDNRDTSKIGSLQAFVKAECTMDDLSPSMINKDEVHKIALLDIRLLNADRNAANILCRRRPADGSIELVPIDHGFCLRSVGDVSWMDWCWLDWPQMKEPISKRIKEYIKRIDIDADCTLLKETLNIQGAALDYFRASNKLLKEGVNSGLSLYEIAILCCRNDDLGEVPSKLERLTQMATELATSAVHNGRWHHAAASRAIAEQLSPRPVAWSSSSTMPRFLKSASSADMTSFIPPDAPDEGGDDAPGMAHSSVSDASSDVGDEGDENIDREECDEWAAAVVADLDQNKLNEVDISTNREDDSFLSSSPKGFWVTRPGESLCNDSDDDTITWSPHVSPRNTKLLSADHLFPLVPKVTFSDPLVGSLILPPAASLQTNSPSPILYMRPPSKSTSGISKSQSFAAFHSLSTVSNISTSIHSKAQAPDDDSDAWKGYFSKFVDLVIERETAAAARPVPA